MCFSTQFSNLHSMEHVFQPEWLSIIPMVNGDTQFSNSVRLLGRLLSIFCRWWPIIKHMRPNLVPPEGWNVKAISWIHINMNGFHIWNVSVVCAHLFTDNISEWKIWWNNGIPFLTVLIFKFPWISWLNCWSLIWWNQSYSFSWTSYNTMQNISSFIMCHCMSTLAHHVHCCFFVFQGNVNSSGLVNIFLDLFRERLLPYHIDNVEWML